MQPFQWHREGQGTVVPKYTYSLHFLPGEVQIIFPQAQKTIATLLTSLGCDPTRSCSACMKIHRKFHSIQVKLFHVISFVHFRVC